MTWLSIDGVAEARTTANLPRLRAHHGHVAALVVHAVLLLEAGVVLLVDDDQAEVLERQEQRRAGADHDARLPGGGRAPGAAALGRGQRRMPLDRRAAEAPREAVHELAGERDLRQHDQRLAPLLQRAGHGLEVDLGLAGAGDAVEQRDGEGLRIGGGAHGVGGAGLGIGQVRPRVRRVGDRQSPLGDRHLDEGAGRDQAIDDAGGAPCFRGQRALGADEPVGGDLERALAGGRHARRRRRVARCA